jgi:hypothetical protein
MEERRTLPSSTGRRNIHYIEFRFEIAKTRHSIEPVRQAVNGTA